MSQPKQQLDTFKSWLGKGVSDISYYLNSHHIDFHEWCMENRSRPVSVTATASSGVAAEKFGISCEDTITLTVQWENLDESGSVVLVIFMLSSLIFPAYRLPDTRARHGHGRIHLQLDCTQERCALPAAFLLYGTGIILCFDMIMMSFLLHVIAQRGEINVDQAHRGYSMADDASSRLNGINPLFMKYVPTDGKFSGQTGYGYRYAATRSVSFTP